MLFEAGFGKGILGMFLEGTFYIFCLLLTLVLNQRNQKDFIFTIIECVFVVVLGDVRNNNAER